MGTVARLKNDPTFQRIVEEVRVAPVATRLDFLLNIMNVGEMRKRGINLPEGSEVKLQRLCFDAKFIRHIVDLNLGEIRLAGNRAN